MLKWCLLLISIIMIGCSYKQPLQTEPHGIVQALGELRILKIDDERVINFANKHIYRLAPGSHTLLLERGYSKNKPVQGTKSPYAVFPLEVKDGMYYYLDAATNTEDNDLFFGFSMKDVVSWYPVLKREVTIEEAREQQDRIDRGKLPIPKSDQKKKFTEKQKTIEEQQKKIEEQERIINEQLKKIEEQERIINQQNK